MTLARPQPVTIPVRSLGKITSRSLSFIRLETEAKEIDLVELASDALRLHDQQIAEKRINVQIRSAESAHAFVKRGEIFQVLTNLTQQRLSSVQEP